MSQPKSYADQLRGLSVAALVALAANQAALTAPEAGARGLGGHASAPAADHKALAPTG